MPKAGLAFQVHAGHQGPAQHASHGEPFDEPDERPVDPIPKRTQRQDPGDPKQREADPGQPIQGTANPFPPDLEPQTTAVGEERRLEQAESDGCCDSVDHSGHGARNDLPVGRK